MTCVATKPNYKPPFPWFGGKSRIAPSVWARFGTVRNYVEPFMGSLAMLQLRPGPIIGTETVNDADGFLANFWRAVQYDPTGVAGWADWPVNENDLHARHYWLKGQRTELTNKLEGDPFFHDSQIAGWWVWGQCCWIGSGWCDESRQGPWSVVEVDGDRQLVHLGDAGTGVNRKRVHLGNAGRGVNRKLVHLGDAGRGVNRQLVHLGEAHAESIELASYFKSLSERLRRVRVCSGDWTRVCGGKDGTALRCLFASGGECGVFLDPPYADSAKRTKDLYSKDSESIAHAVRKWALANGDNPKMRIALCGYEGEHKMPKSWECLAWKAPGGYGSQARDKSNANAARERIWFSPHCITES